MKANKRQLLPAVSACVLLGLAAVGQVHAANVIVNGDFETGTLAGWTQTGVGTPTTVNNTLPLAGTFSAVQTFSASAQLSQTFTSFTTAVTTSFIFSATDPGGDGTRSMNVAWRNEDDSSAINLRLTDIANGGVGDIQAFDGTTWQTVLSNVVVFDPTPSIPSTSLTLTINSFGVGANYDLTVGSTSATAITYFHGGVMNELNELAFVQSGLTAGSSVKFDNVSVDLAVIPEPSAALLGGLGLLGLLRRRRN